MEDLILAISWTIMFCIGTYSSIKVVNIGQKMFMNWFLDNAKRPRSNNKSNSEEPNVNDLDFESLEYLVNIIDEKPQTDYQLKVLARYELLKKRGSKKIVNPYFEKNTLPEGFTIEYNSYNKGYYPKYGQKYLRKIVRIFLEDNMSDVKNDYCNTEKEARDVIEEYYNIDLGNAEIKTIR